MLSSSDSENNNSNSVVLYNENNPENAEIVSAHSSSPLFSSSSLQRPSASTSTVQLADGSRVWLRHLQFNLADSMDQCFEALAAAGLPVSPGNGDGGGDFDEGGGGTTRWCNATWDTVLCWPATPGGNSVTLQCPPLKGLDPSKTITKHCHSSGHWLGKTEDDFARPHGWTNFTMCFTREVVAIMQQLDNGTLHEAQEVAKNARKLEFVGLGLSLVSLLFCIAIFSCFRRLRVFRNLLHLHLMVAILAVVLIRLVLYIDLIFTDLLGNQQLVNPQGRTINTMVVVCELMFFLLEYFKSVAFWWMFLEGLFLHNQLVLAVFNTTPRLWPYLLTGYGFPLVHTLLWLLILLAKKGGKLERCLGSYYLEVEFWVLDGPRLAQLVVNTLMLINVIRVLWLKVRDSSSSSEVERMKKSVKAALMLIPLLGIPNIMQTIPFSPTHDNITFFAIWTYCASFTYMYQGFMIAIIYCFTNREVQAAIKNCYIRRRLAHSRPLDRHKGGGSHYTQIASPYSQIRNNSSSLGANGVGAAATGAAAGQNSCSTAAAACIKKKGKGERQLLREGKIATTNSDAAAPFLLLRSNKAPKLETSELANCRTPEKSTERECNATEQKSCENLQLQKRCSLPVIRHKKSSPLPSAIIRWRRQLSIHGVGTDRGENRAGTPKSLGGAKQSTISQECQI